MRMIVAIKTAAETAFGLVKHILGNRARDRSTETDMPDNQSRVWTWSFEGSAVTRDYDITEYAAMAALIDSSSRGAGKKSNHSIVVSIEDIKDEKERKTAKRWVEDAARQFADYYAPDSPAKLFAGHEDKLHIHMHIQFSNYDEKTGRCIRFSKADLHHMNHLHWYEGPLRPGAYSKRKTHGTKQARVYPKAKNLVVDDLVEELGMDPENNLRRLVESGKARIVKEGTAIYYQDRVISLAHVNFELRKRLGVTMRFGKAVRERQEYNDEVEQEVHFNHVAGRNFNYRAPTSATALKSDAHIIRNAYGHLNGFKGVVVDAHTKPALEVLDHVKSVGMIPPGHPAKLILLLWKTVHTMTRYSKYDDFSHGMESVLSPITAYDSINF